MAATGARRGEICGLRWGDIDSAQRSIRIERSVSATTASGVFVKTTKTGGVRRVTITAQAIDALHVQYERAETCGVTIVGVRSMGFGPSRLARC